MNRSPAVPLPVRTAVRDERLPALVLDLAAVDSNCADLHRRARGTPIRVASKSLRIPALIAHVLAKPGFEGILAYSVQEAIDLVQAGISDDVVVAYPSVDKQSLLSLYDAPSLSSSITLMVDSVEHVQWLHDNFGQPNHPIRICLDVDASWRPGGGVHVGMLRSPTHDPSEAARVAKEVVRTPGLQLVGVMMYEGHIAGVGDAAGGFRQRIIRAMQKAARPALAKQRRDVVEAVTAVAGPLEFVNGGGTGSLESTSAEPAVTEVAAGSGIVGPTLFDTYAAFSPTPAQWFVLPVVRRPKPGTVTVAGGGRIASGPAGEDRLPIPVWPEGLAYAATEGPGEVQTPLTGAGDVALGDPVWFRHAKAGESAEHAIEALVVADGAITGRWPTYRGEGRIYT